MNKKLVAQRPWKHDELTSGALKSEFKLALCTATRLGEIISKSSPVALLNAHPMIKGLEISNKCQEATRSLRKMAEHIAGNIAPVKREMDALSHWKEAAKIIQGNGSMPENYQPLDALLVRAVELIDQSTAEVLAQEGRASILYEQRLDKLCQTITFYARRVEESVGTNLRAC